MRPFLAAATAAVVLATGAAAQAQQVLSAGGIFGGPAQVRAVCYFHNSGTATLGLSGPQITNQAGTALPLVVNECGAGALLPGRTCGIAANVPKTTWSTTAGRWSARARAARAESWRCATAASGPWRTSS